MSTEKQANENLFLQLSLFEDVTEEDIKKAMYILKHYKKFSSITKNYESAVHSATDSIVDSPVKVMHALIPKNTNQAKYLFYGWITNVVNSIIANVDDPHEKLIAKLLFVEGKRYSDVRNYLAAGYKKELHPIQNTAFSDKRRRVIKTVTNSLKIIGVLDYVEATSDGKMVFNYSMPSNVG